MWLRRLVGVTMIVTLIGMNVIAVMGLFAHDKPAMDGPQTVNDKPTVSLTVTPGNISAGTTTTLSWSTTGSPSSCNASGSWNGVKTPFGAESSGRIKNPGKYKYVLTCSNSNGSSNASVSLKVSKGVVVSSRPSSGSSSGSSGGKTYCSGRTPCYNAKDVGAHNSKGNCWGWLGDRVINVTGLDVGFHIARSGVSTIELPPICGQDLTSAVSGGVPGAGYPSGHDHQLGAKSTSDKNYLSYFVGYFDASKR
ncbi:MAG: hypothetical protein ACXWLH_01240 [Candidatus Saccharimonadales bacterium]